MKFCVNDEIQIEIEIDLDKVNTHTETVIEEGAEDER